MLSEGRRDSSSSSSTMQTIISYAAPHHATSLPYDNQNQRSKKYQNKNYVRSLQSHMLHTCRHPAWFPVVRSSPFMFYRIHIHSPLPTFLELCAAFCAPLALQTTVYNFVHIFFVYSTPLNSLLVVLLKGGSQMNWLFGAKSVLCGNRRRKSWKSLAKRLNCKRIWMKSTLICISSPT